MFNLRFLAFIQGDKCRGFVTVWRNFLSTFVASKMSGIEFLILLFLDYWTSSERLFMNQTDQLQDIFFVIRNGFWMFQVHNSWTKCKFHYCRLIFLIYQNQNTRRQQKNRKMRKYIKKKFITVGKFKVTTTFWFWCLFGFRLSHGRPLSVFDWGSIQFAHSHFGIHLRPTFLKLYRYHYRFVSQNFF